MAHIEIKDDQISAALDRLSAHLSDLTPFYQEAGEILTESTKQRFVSGVAPDGSGWAPNSPVTISRKGRKPPLWGESGNLRTKINHEAGPEGLIWGTGAATRDYAATQQFGAAKGAFGVTKFNGPIPWGNIPARPFLGISQEDRSNLLDCLREYLEEAIDNG